MSTAVESNDRFRMGFVLVLTLANTVAFLAMISGFFTALLLADVFAGLLTSAVVRGLGSARKRESKE